MAAKIFQTVVSIAPNSQFVYSGDGSIWNWFYLSKVNLGSLSLQLDQGALISVGHYTRVTTEFSSFTLTNNNATAISSVTFCIGNSEIDYDIEHSNTPVGTLNSHADVSVAALTTVQLVPGGTASYGAIISNPAGAAGPVRIGESNTDATHGAWLQPGASMTVPYGGAIYAYNPHATLAVAIALTQMTQ